MFSTAKYLFSGASYLTTGTVPVLGMDRFSVNINSFGFGTSPATGTVNLSVRLDQSDTFTTIASYGFDNNSGAFYQFDGPIESLRATLNPYSTGSFSAIVRYSSTR